MTFFSQRNYTSGEFELQLRNTTHRLQDMTKNQGYINAHTGPMELVAVIK